MLPFFVSEFSPAGNSEAHSEKRRALRIDVKKMRGKRQSQPSPLPSLRGNQREIFKHVFWLMPALRIFSARNPDAFPLISQWHMFGYRGNYRGATASDFHGLPFV